MRMDVHVLILTDHRSFVGQLVVGVSYSSRISWVILPYEYFQLTGASDPLPGRWLSVEAPTEAHLGKLPTLPFPFRVCISKKYCLTCYSWWLWAVAERGQLQRLPQWGWESIVWLIWRFLVIILLSDMNHEDAPMPYIIWIFSSQMFGFRCEFAFAVEDYNYNVSHFSGGDPTVRLSKAGFIWCRRCLVEGSLIGCSR